MWSENHHGSNPQICLKIIMFLNTGCYIKSTFKNIHKLIKSIIL